MRSGVIVICGGGGVGDGVEVGTSSSSGAVTDSSEVSIGTVSCIISVVVGTGSGIGSETSVSGVGSREGSDD